MCISRKFIMICIIPARSGSKRIKDKNLLVIEGMPVLVHTIRKAKALDLFRKIYVSTDDENYAELARSAGAQPVLRPQSLSHDFASTGEVLSDVVTKLNIENSELVCCLYPVTPLLNPKRIFEAIEFFLSKNHKYVFPAIPMNQQHQRSFTIKSSGAVSVLSEENIDKRTQDLPVLFTDAGQFYLGYAETWRSQQPILSSHSGAISMKLWEVIDVDTPEDWEVVLSLYHSRDSIERELLTESKVDDQLL